MMTSAAEERKAAEKALAVIRSLTPTTQRMDAIIFPLRYAASLATDARRQSFSGEATLNNIRGEAATALNGVCGAMDRKGLTRDLIDRARNAVAAWLSAIKPY